MDYSKITDFKLGLAVAKAMGYTVYAGDNGGRTLYGILSPVGNVLTNLYYDKNQAWSEAVHNRLPQWSTDIGAAFGLAVESGISIIRTDTGWFAGRYDTDQEYLGIDNGIIDGHFGNGYAHAETAPRAICIAYLNWKDAQP